MEHIIGLKHPKRKMLTEQVPRIKQYASPPQLVIPVCSFRGIKTSHKAEKK